MRISAWSSDVCSSDLAELVAEFLEFIGDAPLVIHNAEFDMRFINAELERLGFPPIVKTRAVDTVALARKRFPGAQRSEERRIGKELSGRLTFGGRCILKK